MTFSDKSWTESRKESVELSACFSGKRVFIAPDSYFYPYFTVESLNFILLHILAKLSDNSLQHVNSTTTRAVDCNMLNYQH